jgi:hypothetical protein
LQRIARHARRIVFLSAPLKTPHPFFQRPQPNPNSELLAHARDPDALERPFAKCLSRQPQPDDWQTPLVRMVARGNAGAVRALLSHGANTAARPTNGRPLLEEIAALLAAERVD